MALKPGQIKDLKIKIKKLKELQDLEKKLGSLTSQWLTLVDKPPSKISKKAQALADTISNQMEVLRKQIAALEKKASNNPQIVKIVNAISKDCSQIVAYYRKSGNVLMRGIESKADIFVGRSWANRKPTHSKALYQELYDRVLKKNGFKALRSNSIFTTGRYDHAEEYGDVFIIFPKNGFAYHWNKEVPDLVLDDPTVIFKEGLILDLIDDANAWSAKNNKRLLDFDLYDIYDDPQGFINTLKRIKFPKASQLTVDKLVDEKYIMSRIGPTKTNFAAGVDSGHEVMIAGEYYAVRDDSDLAAEILQALKIDAFNRHF